VTRKTFNLVLIKKVAAEKLKDAARDVYLKSLFLLEMRERKKKFQVAISMSATWGIVDGGCVGGGVTQLAQKCGGTMVLSDKAHLQTSSVRMSFRKRESALPTLMSFSNVFIALQKRQFELLNFKTFIHAIKSTLVK